MGYPVEIERGEGSWQRYSYGYVVEVGDQWVVLQQLKNAVYVDGYQLLRIADITKVSRDPDGGFVERAVVALGRPESGFHLPEGADTRAALGAAANHSALISVVFEALDDSIRLVGHLAQLNARTFEMQLINARGVWTRDETRNWYRDVTCVSFGSRYEAALERFGDARPGGDTDPPASTDMAGDGAGAVQDPKLASTREIRTLLERAASERCPVEVRRGRDGWENWVNGYVVSVGQQWVVLQSLVDNVYVEGYDVLRLVDITDVTEDREGGFIDRAVAVLGRPAVTFGPPEGADTRVVLEAAASHGGLVSVWFEKEADSPRLVGHPGHFGSRDFALLEIDSGGQWTSEPTRCWYKDVTSVSLGSRYEAALEQFGDARPSAP